MNEMLAKGLGMSAYAVFLLALLVLTRPAYAAFRKRRSGFGIVSNSVTGAPESLASVSLRDLHGRIVRTVVTDNDGRYKLLAPKGEYFVEIKKFGFRFLSKHIIIKDHGVMTINIPIDPEQGKRSPSWIPHIQLGKRWQYAIAFLSPLVALILPLMMRTSMVAWILFGVYILVFLGRIFSFKPAEPPFGVVRDAKTGLPLEKAVVRAFDAAYNKLLETQVTSAKGRYAFIVDRGTYRVRIECAGYRTVVLNFPHIAHDAFILAKDVRMKPMEQV